MDPSSIPCQTSLVHFPSSTWSLQLHTAWGEEGRTMASHCHTPPIAGHLGTKLALIATHRPLQGTLAPSLPGLVLTGWPCPLTPALLWAPVSRISSSPLSSPFWPSHVLHCSSFSKTPDSHFLSMCPKGTYLADSVRNPHL